MDTDTSGDAPSRTQPATKTPWRRRVWRHGLQLLAVSGLAVAQPLLDIYGRNPEAFVANDLSSGQIIAFSLAIVLLPPAIALAAETLAYGVGERIGEIVHGVALAGFTALFAAVLLRQMDVDAVAIAATVVVLCGVGLALAESRFEVVRTGLRYLALAPVAFLLLFLFASDTSRLVTSSGAEPTGEVSWEGSERPPVVFLVLDELPLATIIGADGQVNEERFPNFARLADQSDWFRNASSNAYLTEHAVPSLLTGASPSTELLPIASDYPDNLFTLLGPAYDVWEYQVFTDLCPGDICSEEGPGGRRGGVSQALTDASVVYRHLVLPESMRDDLARIDQSWNEFIVDDGVDRADNGSGAESEADGSGSEEPDGDDKWHAFGPEGRAANAQASVIEELTADLDADAESRLWFAHVALPHAPWTITPMGNELADRAPRHKYEDLTDGQKKWSARLSRQLHLLQAGATDQKLGELIDRMQELGIWESALVVVAADHGRSFLPPDVGRTPTEDNAHAVFRVPMFVKQPGQTMGSVRDENAVTVDLLPSIADLLAIDTGWPFDGHSLFDGSAYPADKRVLAGPTTPKYVSTSFDEFIGTVVAEHERDFPRADWIGVAAIGRHAGLLGEDAGGLNAFDDGSVSVDISQAEELAALDLGAGVVPALIQGTLHLPDGEPPPDELLLVLNGRVGGVAGGLVRTDGGWSFAGIVAEQFFVDGENTLDVLIPRTDGSFSRAD